MVEKVCLAIKWVVGALRYYLLGCDFTLCLDHDPLHWLHRMKDIKLHIRQWYLALQLFSFHVVHRSETQMLVTVFLSRLPEQEKLGRPRPQLMEKISSVFPPCLSCSP